MKFRIIEHKPYQRKPYYTIQEKRFIFWHTVEDIYDCEVIFYNLEKAKDCCDKWLHKTEKKIVYTTKD